MALDRPSAVTGRALVLLKALRSNGDWMGRAAIALATGKNRLSPHDIDLLQRLIDAGYVEVQERPSNAPVGVAFEYRATSKE